MDKRADFVGKDRHGIVIHRVIAGPDDVSLGLYKAINEAGKRHRDWRKVEFREFADVVLTLVDGSGLANARVGDEEGIEIRVKWPGGLEPNLLLKCRRDGVDCCPLAEDRRGMEVSGLVYEGFDPRD